jgi:hypothetical protein
MSGNPTQKTSCFGHDHVVGDQLEIRAGQSIFSSFGDRFAASPKTLLSFAGLTTANTWFMDQLVL